eukprot:2489864-Alexandrium_andersonii.AAC.1
MCVIRSSVSISRSLGVEFTYTNHPYTIACREATIEQEHLLTAQRRLGSGTFANAYLVRDGPINERAMSE